MVLKFCTNIFCPNKEVYLKYVFVSDEKQVQVVNFLIVSSKYVYLSNFIISCSTSNQATNYGHKVLYKQILSEQRV